MNTATMAAGRSSGMWLGAGALILIVSLGAALSALMSSGHAAFNTTGDGVSWGLPVVAYVYFSMLSTGLALVASLSTVFGYKEFAPIAKRCTWVSIGALVAGFTALALEMGHPFRMLWAVPLNFQPSSALVWMGIFYLVCLVLLVLKFQKIQAGDWDSPGSHLLAKLGVVFEVLAIGTLGAAFGMMAMRPLWYGPEVPALYLATACLLGVAGAFLFTFMAYGTNHDAMPPKVKALMTGPLPKLFALVIAVSVVFVGYRAITTLWSNADGLQAAHAMYKSPLFFFEFFVGLLLPLYMMTNAGMRNNPTMQLVAALLVAVAAFIGRYEYIIGGQLVPLFKGSWVEGMISYAPSGTEWMLVVLAVGITLTVYAFGEKSLNLADEPRD
jgi:molybdopterin-containing oxidoreductase family membrane subunit